jgi:PAS domain S-box-containing protein
MLGYSADQVTGSHFSLWIPGDCRDDAKKRFDSFLSRPNELPITRERLKVQTKNGGTIIAELSLRSYRTPEGELRMVAILRDESDRPVRRRGEETPHEADDLDVLRSTVEDLRHSDSEHPIKRSLTVLLAALESNSLDQTGHATGSMVAATDRMTQIVESAMLHAPDPSLSFRWLETKELIDMLHFEFRGKHDTAGFELQIDALDAPPLVWGDDALLGVALGSLLDWAIESTCGPAEILLRVQTTDNPTDHDGIVVFSVSSPASTSDSPAVDSVQADDRAAFDARAKLALATAEDAACALGGSLVLPEESTVRSVIRIRLPQPPVGRNSR